MRQEDGGPRENRIGSRGGMGQNSLVRERGWI